MSTQQSDGNIISMMFAPISFVLLVFLFSVSHSSSPQASVSSQQYVVGLASIIIVSIAVLGCIVTAAFTAPAPNKS